MFEKTKFISVARTYDNNVGDLQVLDGILKHGQNVQIIARHLVANVSVHKYFSRAKNNQRSFVGLDSCLR